ncbi:MAG: lycopene cyclase family protein [Balneolaceae bacterium]|nr:lycopene cyclase family protein [Balneolaceae bacterium]
MVRSARAKPGIQAGLTKPSTGYTFRRIQNHSRNIVKELSEGNMPSPATRSERRFRSYDLWLLQIIHDHPDEAITIFHQLFKNNSLDDVFRFLGEETNIQQDLHIMASVPWWPFFRAIWKTRKSFFLI